MTTAVLCIGATDPTGGAGLARDLTTLAAFGVWGAPVVTAVTVQDVNGLTRAEAMDPALVAEQIAAAISTPVHAIKIGALPTVDIVAVVADALRAVDVPSVLDPVVAASAGGALAAADVPDAIASALFPLVTVVTPNLSEAERASGLPIADRADQERAAVVIRSRGANAVLVTGGHLADEEAPDVLVDDQGSRWFTAPRRATAPTHGTGCALSSAIAAGLARGSLLDDAIEAAKEWVRRNLDTPLGLGWRR